MGEKASVSKTVGDYVRQDPGSEQLQRLRTIGVVTNGERSDADSGNMLRDPQGCRVHARPRHAWPDDIAGDNDPDIPVASADPTPSSKVRDSERVAAPPLWKRPAWMPIPLRSRRPEPAEGSEGPECPEPEAGSETASASETGSASALPSLSPDADHSGHVGHGTDYPDHSCQVGHGTAHPDHSGQDGHGTDDSDPLTHPAPGRPSSPRTSWPRFGKPQLVVIVVIAAIGIGLAGWAVLRARPIALAAPQAGSSASAGSSRTTSATTTRATSTGTTSAGRGSSQKTGTAPNPSDDTSGRAPKIKIHVTGAVSKPGVLTLRQGARVEDVIAKAGGTTHHAALGQVNLAQPVADGQQLVVAKRGGSGKHKTRLRDPAAGDAEPARPSASGASTDQAGTDTSDPNGLGAQTKVNLNSATESELEELSGVGPVTAKKIIDWRKQNNRFSSPKELQEVDGIGPKRFADLAGNVTVR